MKRYIFKKIKFPCSVPEYEIYPLIKMADYLLDNGFKFCEASIGGGTNEVSHTGGAGYGAKYTDLDDFRKNYQKDFEEAESRKYEESGGWISFLSYDRITFIMSNEAGKIAFMYSDLDSSEQTMIVIFDHHCSDCEELSKMVKDKMYEILGENVEFSQGDMPNMPSMINYIFHY